MTDPHKPTLHERQFAAFGGSAFGGRSDRGFLYCLKPQGMTEPDDVVAVRLPRSVRSPYLIERRLTLIRETAVDTDQGYASAS